jgi:hypothetical protein
MRGNISLNWQTASKHFFGQPQNLFKGIRNSPFTRGLPPSKILQQSATAKVFKKAIAYDGIFESSFENENENENENEELKKALQNIWRNGWLHAEMSGYDVRYVFPSHIHRW